MIINNQPEKKQGLIIKSQFMFQNITEMEVVITEMEADFTEDKAKKFLTMKETTK